MNTNPSSIKKSTVITYLTQILSIGISFIYVPIMLGILGQEEYGLYALVQSIVSYFLMSDMGIGITATRYNAKYIAEKDIKGQRAINGMFLILYVGISLFCALVGYVLYLQLPTIYSHYSPESVDLVQKLFVLAMINLVLTLVFKVFNAIINAYEKFVFAKTLVFIQSVFGPLAMLAVLFWGYRSVGMVMVTTLMTLLFGIVQMIYCFSVLKVKFDFSKFDKALFLTIMSFTIFVFLNSLSHQLFSNSDKIIVSILLTEASVAIYAIVIQFQTYFYNFTNVLSGFYLPRFTKAVKESRVVSHELIEDIIRTGRVQLIIAGLVFGGFLSLGLPFIVRWVGPEYELSYYLTLFVLFCEFTASSQSMFNSLMQAMNLHKFRSIIGFISAIIKVFITIALVYVWGIWGCAIAYFISFFIRLIAYNVYYKHIGIDIVYFWKKILRLLIPLSTIILSLYVLFSIIQKFVCLENYLFIVVFATLYGTLFLWLLWIFGFNDYEKHLSKQMYNRLTTVFNHGK